VITLNPYLNVEIKDKGPGAAMAMHEGPDGLIVVCFVQGTGSIVQVPYGDVRVVPRDDPQPVAVVVQPQHGGIPGAVTRACN
jgi:hypothetical protein